MRTNKSKFKGADHPETLKALHHWIEEQRLVGQVSLAFVDKLRMEKLKSRSKYGASKKAKLPVRMCFEFQLILGDSICEWDYAHTRARSSHVQLLSVVLTSNLYLRI